MVNAEFKAIISALLYGQDVTQEQLEGLGRYNGVHIAKLLKLPAKDLALKLQDDFNRKSITRFKAV